jgi:hypothetical protein
MDDVGNATREALAAHGCHAGDARLDFRKARCEQASMVDQISGQTGVRVQPYIRCNALQLRT